MFGGAKLALMDTAQADRAPEPLDLLRLFVNTLDYPAGPDQLGTLEAASQWCRRHGLPLLSNQADVERLRAFREVLRDLLSAHNGAADEAAAWKSLRPFLDSARFRLAVHQGHAPALEAAGSGVEGAIATMLAIVYEAIADGTWSRLRACRKHTCRFAYYDRSKNGSRAWCSMALCGNQEKASRRRSRERHDAHSATSQ